MMTKKSSLKILFAVIAVCAFVLSGVFAVQRGPLPAYAAEEGAVSGSAESVSGAVELSDFTMEVGAEVRKSAPVGLRFKTTVSAADLARLPVGAQFGTLLLPAEYAESKGELTAETEGVLDVPALRWYRIDGDTYTYTAVLIGNDGYGLEEEFYGVEITARAYVTYTDSNGEKHTNYAESAQTRSAAYVASAALANKETDDENVLLGIVDAVVDTFGCDDTSLVLTVGETVIPQFTGTEGLVVGFDPADTDVVDIENGAIVGVAPGNAVVTARLGSSAVTLHVTVEEQDVTAPVIERASGEISLAAGSRVALSEEGLGLSVEESGEYTLSYRVFKTLGGATAAREEMQVSDGFAVEAGYFYEIYITATDDAENESGSYVLVKDENLIMLSFENGMTLGEYRLVFEDAEENGNHFLKIVGADDYVGPQLIFSDEVVPEGAYEVYVSFGTDHWAGAGAEWFLESESGVLLSSGGRYRLPTTIANSAADVSESLCWMKTVRADGTINAGNYVTLDNIVLVPAENPQFTMETEFDLTDKTNGLALTAEGLGITACKDQLGNVLTPEIISVSAVTETGSFVLDKAWGDTITESELADGVYTIELSATDVWGNTSIATITVQVGNKDLIAPAIEKASGEISLAAGGTVTLSEEGLGLSVEERGEYTLSYQVYKTLGGGTAAREEMPVSDSFAVEAGYFYEIYITATDEAGNEGKSYVLVKDESLLMLSFENNPDLAEILFGTYNFKYTTEQDEWGNTSLIWQTEISANWESDFIISLPEMEGSAYNVYFNYGTKGTQATEWLMQSGQNTGTIISMGMSGRDLAATNLGDHPNAGTQVWLRFTVNPEQLIGTDMRMVFDNVVLVSAA